jgi:deoxyribonuclease-4
MELEFVQRVSMGPEAARETREAATSEGIRLTVHAPYYINFNAREPEKVEASRERLLKAARVGFLCGAEGVVFHPGFYVGVEPNQTYDNIRDQLDEAVGILRAEGNSISLRPETTGKPSQFGSLEETLRLCSDLDGVDPCVDFSHLHARSQGEVNSRQDFARILTRIAEVLGEEALRKLHMHFSGIEYGPRGERKHLVLREAEIDYRDFLEALRDLQVGGTLICESPNLEEDALLLKETYLSL